MVRAWHQHNGHEFEPTPRDSAGQGSLAGCSPWSHKEMQPHDWATIATTTASLNRWILSEKTWTVPVCFSSHRPSILPENCPYFVSVFLPSPRQLLYIILSYLKLPVPFSETAHLRDLRILSQILWWKWNNNHQPLPFSSLTIRHASLAYPTSLHFLQWR